MKGGRLARGLCTDETGQRKRARRSDVLPSMFRAFGYAAWVRFCLVAVLGLSLSTVGCSDALLSSLPADIGQPTESSEVVALAGPDLVVLEGSRVMLAGSGSRALLGAPTLRWSQREGPLVVLSSASAATPTFVAPLGPARLVFSLEVSTDAATFDRDDVVVFVVTDSDAVVPPAVLTLPGDRVSQVNQMVLVDAVWTGLGIPQITARCRVARPPSVQVTDNVLSLAVEPLDLPCPVVVDDVVIDDGDDRTIERGAGRAAFSVWPAGTTLSPTTQVPVPATASPSSEVAIVIRPDAAAFFVDGLPNTPARVGDTLSFVTPKSAGRVTLLVEERLAGTSGGARVIPIEVGPGEGNVAPSLIAGNDLRVQPGARFRIAPTVSDDDGDETSVTISQVLGSAARSAGGDLGVLVAPDVRGPETLLFHVSASDGVVESAPQSVRVLIDPSAENLPPVLELPPERYVRPGQRFVLDVSAARDPDAGLIAAYRIAQDADDDVVLLPEPVDAVSVELVAGVAGDVYRFALSAVDDGGLEVSTTVRILVEDAGPFVDAVRGSPLGPGTAGAPFSSVDAAVETASRHGFGALLLAAGDEAVSAGLLPDGLGLEGGYVFDEGSADYAQSDGVSAVRLSGPTLRVSAASLHRIRLSSSSSATLELQRRAELNGVTIDGDIDVVVDLGARVDIADCALGLLHSAGVAAVADSSLRQVVVEGASTTLAGRTEVASVGGIGVDVQRGLFLTEATTRVSSDVVAVRAGVDTVVNLGGAVVGEGEGVRAVVVAGGTVAISGVINARGDGAVGIDAQNGTVGGSANVSVAGAGAVGMRAAGGFGGVVNGVVDVSGADAVGVSVGNGAFARLKVSASGQRALGMRGARLDLESCLIDVDGRDDVDDEDGVDADGRAAVAVAADAGRLAQVTLLSTGLAARGPEPEAATPLALENLLFRAPLGVEGDVAGGVVGYVVDVLDSFDPATLVCSRCIEGTSAALDEDGGLNSDEDLGVVNPFVDVGDDAGVAADLDGLSIPQGAGPDLGARERPVASE